jgi:hypothetical protein
MLVRALGEEWRHRGRGGMEEWRNGGRGGMKERKPAT